MIRKAFRASIQPGQADEYQRRHAPIWRELEETLIRHGVRSYSIYLDPQNNDVFGYLEIECEERWAAVASTEVCRRWWRHMREIMPAHEDDRPVTRELGEVFHLQAAVTLCAACETQRRRDAEKRPREAEKTR